MNQEITLPSRRRILTATVTAALVALIVLVTTILPAEYGIDPLGTGRALGLTALFEAGEGAPPSTPMTPPPTSATFNDDVYTVELRPFEGVEYKYRLEQGGSLVYSWQATAPVEYEFHGEPDGAPAKYFDSYDKGSGGSGSGGFIAAKAGLHGWYWKNTGAGRVTVTLRSAGFYSISAEYRDGDRTERKFPTR
jgi:hypothetical protein